MSRAVSSVVAVVLLALVTVALAGGFVVTVTDAVPSPESARPVSIAVGADPSGRVVLEHRGGPPLNGTALRLVVSVDGRRLRHQPPVPFFAAAGFHGGPTGPFNDASDPTWTVGETASFRVAATNEPSLRPGRRLSVIVYADGERIATATTRIA